MFKEGHPEIAGGKSPPFPVTATLAGLIWLLYGSLALVSFVLRFTASRASGEGAPASPCLFVFPALIALVFMHVGWTTIRGRAKGTAANGCGSLIWGCLHFVFIPPLLAANRGANLSVMDYAVFVFPAGLLVAGVLALLASDKYRQWRTLKGK